MAKILTEGDRAPDFSLPVTEAENISLSDFAGKWLVLYFYPKDDTSGCTQQAIDFTQMRAEFEKLGANILGISKDSLRKHHNFIRKHELGIALASDEEVSVNEAYGVWKEKSMYGRKYMGTERSTFVIGPDGKILKIWRKVKVKGHAKEVLQFIENLATD